MDGRWSADLDEDKFMRRAQDRGQGRGSGALCYTTELQRHQQLSAC